MKEHLGGCQRKKCSTYLCKSEQYIYVVHAVTCLRHVCAHARVCTHSAGVFVVILSFCGVFDIVLRAFASIKASN